MTKEERRIAERAAIALQHGEVGLAELDALLESGKLKDAEVMYTHVFELLQQSLRTNGSTPPRARAADVIGAAGRILRNDGP